MSHSKMCQADISFRTSSKDFQSAWNNRWKTYPLQADIIEWSTKTITREEMFDDLFIEDLSWAHTILIDQLLKTE